MKKFSALFAILAIVFAVSSAFNSASTTQDVKWHLLTTAAQSANPFPVDLNTDIASFQEGEYTECFSVEPAILCALQFDRDDASITDGGVIESSELGSVAVAYRPE